MPEAGCPGPGKRGGIRREGEGERPVTRYLVSGIWNPEFARVLSYRELSSLPFMITPSSI
jgi:hypothetical protein